MNNSVEYILRLRDQFSAQIRTATAQTNQLDAAVGRVNNSFSSIARLAGGAFAVAGIATFARSVVEVGSKFEAAEMGLKTFLKTSEAAHQTFLNIQTDAASTPFSFDGLLQANRAIISAGVSATDAREDILALGNAVAATGGGNDELQRMSLNLQQIKNVGRATAMDIKQFGMAGINIYGLLSKSTGLSTAKLQEMNISYEALTQALRQAQGEGGMYFGALENAMNTTQGRLSNLGDQFDMFKNQLFIEAKPAIDTIISGLSGLMSGFLGTIKFIKENSNGIIALGIAVASLTIAYKANAIIAGIVAMRTSLMTAGTLAYTVATIASTFATEGFSAGMMSLNIALMANPIGLVIAAIGLLTAGVIYAYNKFEPFRRGLKATWEVIKGVGMAIVQWLVMPFKMAYHGVMALKDALTGNFKGAKENLRAMKDDIMAPINELKKGVSEARKVWDNPEKTAAKKKKQIGSTPTLSSGSGGKVSMPSLSSSSSRLEGAGRGKPVNVNINIGNLVGSQTVNVDGTGQGSNFERKLRESVESVFLAMLNDANRAIQ